MAIFLPKRWTQQPQGSVQIDWSNPLSRNLLFAYLPNNPINLAQQYNTQQFIGDNWSIIKTGVAGIVTDYQSYTHNSSIQTGPFTIGMPGQLYGPTPTLLTDFSYVTRSAYDLGLYLSFSNSSNIRLVPSVDNSAFVTTTVTGNISPSLLTNKTRFVAGTFSTAEVAAWLGNTKLATTTGWDNTVSSLLTTFDVSGYLNQTGFALSGFIWRRVLSANELGMMDENPWQLFRPQTRILYSIPSAPANLVAGRLLKRRYQTQPAGDVQVNWAHPLARGLIYAQVPGSARRGFFRLSDPQITSANFGTGLSNSIFAYSTAAGTNGLGIKGRSAMTDTAGTTSGTLNLRSSAAGGNPVYTYAGVFERSVLDTTQQSIATFAINGGQALTTITQNSGGSVSTFSTRFVDGSANTEIYNATVTNLITDKKLNVVFSVYENGQEPIGIVNNTQLVLDNNVNFDGISTSFSSNYLNATGTYVGLATFFWTRILSASEIASFTQNPWQLFIPAKPVYFAVTSITYSYSRPNADSSPLQWNRFPAGGTHFSAIDEVTSDPSDYLYAPSLGLVDTMTCSAVNQPIAGSNILVNYTTGSTPPSQIKIELLEGSTAIKSSTVSAASGTITIIPAEWAVVSSWPWTPTLRITSQ